MFVRVAFGILIGFIGGLVEALGPSLSKKWQNISEALLFLAGLAFVVSSFMFGVIYGVMAIAEIAGGYYAYTKVFRSKKAES